MGGVRRRFWGGVRRGGAVTRMGPNQVGHIFNSGTTVDHLGPRRFPPYGSNLDNFSVPTVLVVGGTFWSSLRFGGLRWNLGGGAVALWGGLRQLGCGAYS